jgi:hypothetical protein
VCSSDLNDIEATGDHVSQSLATLESNALTIEKINEINPHFGIDKLVRSSSNVHSLPRNNDNLFEYYKYIDSDRDLNIGVLFFLYTVYKIIKVFFMFVKEYRKTQLP